MLPSSTEKTHKNWSRTEIAEWTIDQAKKEITFIAGIDHGFSDELDDLIGHHDTDLSQLNNILEIKQIKPWRPQTPISQTNAS